jgi:Secretion system C-terminal sorting domain
MLDIACLYAQQQRQLQNLAIGNVFTSIRYEENRFYSQNVFVYDRVEKSSVINGKTYFQINRVGWTKPPFNPNLPDTNFVLEREGFWLRSDSLNVFALNLKDSTENISFSVDTAYLQRRFGMVVCSPDTIWGVQTQSYRYLWVILGTCDAYRYKVASPYGNISVEGICNSGIRPSTTLTGAIINGVRYGNPLSLPNYITVTSVDATLANISPSPMLYPNPVTENIHLRLNARKGSVRIFTTTGQEVFSQLFEKENENEVLIPEITLSPGLYVAEITVNGIRNYIKFLKLP